MRNTFSFFADSNSILQIYQYYFAEKLFMYISSGTEKTAPFEICRKRVSQSAKSHLVDFKLVQSTVGYFYLVVLCALQSVNAGFGNDLSLMLALPCGTAIVHSNIGSIFQRILVHSAASVNGAFGECVTTIVTQDATCIHICYYGKQSVNSIANYKALFLFCVGGTT